jgi:hypothetical protein
MNVPIPTPIFRFIHIDNLHIYLERKGMHAPNHFPDDGLVYKTCHNIEIQNERHNKKIPCDPGGVIHDYVPFYFGYLSPMMFQLKTGWVVGYNEGQEPLIYLVSNCQMINKNCIDFVFSDGHGIAAFTQWYNSLEDLDKIDWGIVYERYWSEKNNDFDRQRRKQAEFLIHKFCDWSLIKEIAVIDETMKKRVDEIQISYPQELRKQIIVKRNWYY